MSVVNIWHKIFLEDRPSVGLSFFRIFVALTIGFHVIPTFFAMQDSFLSTALKTYDASFFTIDVLKLVGQSPDWLVVIFSWLFVISWFCFLIGLRTQISCIVMTLCCYFFYALNTFHIGTLSWDILLVTLFLMCLTSYPGDYFSIDALRERDINSWAKPRPFFIQRLLQIQIGLTYFYTALYKISAQGNWITGNPIFALVNYPQEGVTKNFLLKEWMATQPHFCYAMGIIILMVELLMPFLLFWSKTRRSAIILGFIFHLTLILTLDVPAIFLFLYPAQLLLFIDPEIIVQWVKNVRRKQMPMILLYDGNCGFCRLWVERLKVMDLWGCLVFEPMKEALHEMKLVDGDNTYGGFQAFQRLCLFLPMLYPFLLVAYLPGATWVGQWGYKIVAENRSFLNKKACSNNSCSR